MAYESRFKRQDIDELFKAILLLQDEEDCYRFFEDICTVNEIHAIAQRLQVAKLLSENKTYSEIENITKASTATISRINKCLVYGAEGYRRILDRMKIPYTHQAYECDEFVDGIQTADNLGLPHEKVYKTLVTQGNDKQYYVFVLPIEAELDLKKAAKAAGVKSVSMLHVKDITQVTGYVRGGCTAIGMKKQYKTFISDSAKALSDVYVSGGRIGCQMNLAPDDLCKASGGSYADILV